MNEAKKRIPGNNEYFTSIEQRAIELDKELTTAISFIGAIARELGLDEQSSTNTEILEKLRTNKELIKKLVAKFQKIWDDDEMGFIHGDDDSMVECVKCGASAKDESTITHETWCEQKEVQEALQLAREQGYGKESQ